MKLCSSDNHYTTATFIVAQYSCLWLLVTPFFSLWLILTHCNIELWLSNDSLLWLIVTHYSLVTSHDPFYLIVAHFICVTFFHWNSLHARLKSHYEAKSYKKNKKNNKSKQNIYLERVQRQKVSVNSGLNPSLNG